MRSLLCLFMLSLFVLACHSSKLAPPDLDTSGAEQPLRETASPLVMEDPEPGEAVSEWLIQRGPPIPRKTLKGVLAAGLPRFLQRVDLKPLLEKGKFIGFRLLKLRFDDLHLRAIDLKRGDVVTKVNELPIGKPGEALAVWKGLAKVDQIRVRVVRGDYKREILFPVID